MYVASEVGFPRAALKIPQPAMHGRYHSVAEAVNVIC